MSIGRDSSLLCGMTGSFSTPPSFKDLIAKILIFGGVENDPEKTTPFLTSNEEVILFSLLNEQNSKKITKRSRVKLSMFVS